MPSPHALPASGIILPFLGGQTFRLTHRTPQDGTIERAVTAGHLRLDVSDQHTQESRPPCRWVLNTEDAGGTARQDVALDCVADARPLNALSFHARLSLLFTDDLTLRFTYRNWRGEVAERAARLVHLWFGATEYHPDPQWLVNAVDAEKRALRDFALRDMSRPRRYP